MARREYAVTTTDMPEEASIKALPVGAQWLYDRLRFRKEISRCGVLQWRPALFAELAPDATDRKVRSWARHLEDRSQIVLDEPYAECLVRTYVRWDGLLAQPNVIQHLVYDFGLIASPKVRLGFLKEFRRLWDLDALSEAERGGWLAAAGHFPRRKHARDDPAKWPIALEGDTLARLIKGVGRGLYEPLTSAIAAGEIAPFDPDSKHGLPDPFLPSRGGDPIPPPHPPTPSDMGSLVRTGARTGTGLQDPAPAPSPGTGTVSVLPDPDPPTPASTSSADTRTTATQLITTHAGRVAGAVRLALTHHVVELLDENHPPADVAAALTDWKAKPGSGAGLLPWLLTERVLRRDNDKDRVNGKTRHDPWCGQCEEQTRTEPADPDNPDAAYRRCPRCHPLAQPAAASSNWVPASGPDDPPF